MTHTIPSKKTRCAIIALAGQTNVGKSTFVNRMTEKPIAPVTHKAQTTRTSLRAIICHDKTQLILIDTPGLFNPKRTLDHAMIETAKDAVKQSDDVLLMTDARRSPNPHIVNQFSKRKKETILVINKIDCVQPQTLLPLVDAYRNLLPLKETFLISALNGDGCDRVKDFLVRSAPNNPWLYPPDQITDTPETQIAAEITRKHIYLDIHQELPYAASVETTLWKTLRRNDIRIEQIIYVERPAHKPIIVGHQGQKIKKIGHHARIEMQRLFQKKIHLFLFVKVTPKWSHNPQRLRAIGFHETIIRRTQKK